VFVVNNSEKVDGHSDAGVALLRAFNYITKTESAAKALSFLTDVRLYKLYLTGLKEINI